MSCKHVFSRVASLVVRQNPCMPLSRRRLAPSPYVQITRALHYDGRNRSSNFWTPTKIVQPDDAQPIHDLLVRAGFLRQAHSGIFHLLPLGLRVQNKLEQLIDKHMIGLGASKVSLSSLTSEDLWARSGRLEGRDSEFLRLTDRKGAKYLLSPTHEEEITVIVANTVHSYKDLPLRLYQVSRKYRDEARPRQGLLRGREFLMKDLYTFDETEQQAIATYESVREAYCAFLDELRLPYLVANADSGNMGGSLSHEYHFVSKNGEDNVISCKKCGYAINEELFVAPYSAGSQTSTGKDHVDNYLITKQRGQLYNLVIPAGSGELNLHAIKKMLPDVDVGIEDALVLWEKLQGSSPPGEHCITIYDPRCQQADTKKHSYLDGNPILLTKAQDNDACPSCAQASLHITPAVEIGHTFHLSTRYSGPLGAVVLDAKNDRIPIQMGCHGIGISRLIAAVSGILADERGLNWPLAVAPFQAIMVAAPKVSTEDIQQAYDSLTDSLRTRLPDMDVIIDDRQRGLGWKMNDADLIGYPFIIVLGRKWLSEHKVELQCRRLDIKDDVLFHELPDMLKDLASRL